jgi:two-component system chemotaxis response regulator CheY
MIHKILLTDDDPDIRDVVPIVLEPYGIETVVAANGSEGLRIARAQRDFEVILVDLMMPHMSGGEMVVELKADPTLSGIPVIVLSGDNLASEKATALGAAACLRKPVDLITLVSTIDEMVRHHRA